MYKHILFLTLLCGLLTLYHTTNIVGINLFVTESDRHWWYIKDPHKSKPFRWKHFSSDDYLDYYTAVEWNSMRINATNGHCDWNQLDPKCCLGSISTGGGNKIVKKACLAQPPTKNTSFSNSPNYGVNYQKAFEIETSDGYRTPWGMNEFIERLRGRTRVMFWGDSVMNQIFDAMICDFTRRQGNTVGKEYRFHRKKKKVKFGVGQRVELNLTSHRGHTVQVFYHREYKFSVDGLTTKETCKGIDILVVNFGLHWNEPEKYRAAMLLLQSYLDQHCQGVQIIFSGTTAQHFMTPGGLFTKNDTVVEEYVRHHYGRENATQFHDETRKSKAFNSGCSPIVYSDVKSQYNWRNHILLEVWSKRQVIFPSWGGNQTPDCPTSPTSIYFVPMGETTLASWDMRAVECTHFCYSPLLFQPLFDAMALSVMRCNTQLSQLSPLRPLVAPKTQGMVVNKTFPNFQIDDPLLFNTYMK